MKLDNSFIASDAEELVYFPQYFNRMRRECYIEMFGDRSLIVNKNIIIKRRTFPALGSF